MFTQALKANAVIFIGLLGLVFVDKTSDVAFSLIVVQVIVGLFSFGRLEIDEKGYVSFLGRPLFELTPGPYYSIPLIMEAWKVSGAIFQDELPANPERIFREDDKKPVPEGYFPPIRIKFGPPDPTDKDLLKNPYNKEMVVEVPLVVSWQVTNSILFRKHVKTVENMRKILEDKAVSLFNAEFAKVTPAKASRTLEETSDKLRAKLQLETNDLGLHIHDAFIKPFVYSHDLNKAVTGVSESEQRAMITTNDSAAEKQKRIDHGAGDAEARRLMLIAESIGTKELAELAKTPEGQIVLWMETLKTAMQKAQFSIIPGSEAYTALSGLTETFKRIGGRP